MTEHDAYVLLNLTSGIGPARAASLIRKFGSAAAVFEQKMNDLSDVRGITDVIAAKIMENSTGEALEEELVRIAAGKVKIIAKCDPEYPSQLSVLEDAPLCLYLCGKLPDDLETHSIAIVGSRRATPYGVRMAEHIAQSAIYSGWTVVSGLALGIDYVSHNAAVKAQGRTIAVLGGGLMRIQPQEHVPLARQIIENGGAVVSEYPMSFYPTRHSFPMRNRIISGLSAATLVVEAGAHSGALITAATALEQGKMVFAVPGNADSEMSAGCNNLIKNGTAALAGSFEDILESMDFLPGMSPPALGEDGEAPESFNDAVEDSLPESDKAILEILRKGEAGFDEIAGESGLPAHELSRKLVALEIAHRIKRTGNTYSKLR